MAVEWSHQAEIRERLAKDRERILEHVAARPGVTTRELNESLGMSKNRAWLLVPALIRDGHLRREGQALHRVAASQ